MDGKSVRQEIDRAAVLHLGAHCEVAVNKGEILF